MKFLKVLLAIIVIVVAVGFILAMTTDGAYSVERSVVVDACYGDAYEHATNFERWVEWSPWDDLAEGINYTFDGEMGTVGSSYSWESPTEEVGAGTMSCTAISDSRMDFHLHFTKPWESESDGWITVVPAEEGGFKVSWGFAGENPFPMSLFLNMDKMVGPDFEKGLALFKEQVEAKGKPEIQPERVAMPDMNYIGRAAHLNVMEISSDVFGANYGAIMMYMMENAIEMDMTSHPMAIYHTFDEATYEADMEFSIPVVGAHEVPTGFTSGTIPAGDYLVAKHFGSYESTGDTWTAMENYIACHGIEVTGSPFEVYVTDPMSEPDTLKWETDIVYPVGAAK
ncbi:MAG: GyrI-like domain-containing protein [Flavobacteriales bacterium]|nr:GyrI-like domain-containing protein [Flavobacteriales bacterium]